MIQIYGIKNCDTIKKTLNWFKQQAVPFDFVDYKKSPPPESLIQAWLSDGVDWETLINKRGTTWRKLPEPDRADLNPERAVALMVANPSLIKRPVVTHKGQILVGYNETAFEALITLDN
ncbi:MAG: arsenate reductase [Saccharospirillum sp.]|nr:arsenate reductase [Saccharospirillum sp.]